jgi:hypothetical protein
LDAHSKDIRNLRRAVLADTICNLISRRSFSAKAKRFKAAGIRKRFRECFERWRKAKTYGVVRGS